MYQLSPKQIHSYNDSDARINIWQGAVRSGKTFSSLIRFIYLCKHGPEGQFVILGRSQKTIKMNIIEEIYKIIGEKFVTFYSGKGELYIYGRKIHLVGANDERAEKNIRGSTFSCAYVDECTLIPQSVFTILLSRLSVAGALLLATTNPDSPFHWLKTDYLDRRNELNLKTWEFNLEDNPSLTREFKDSLKSEYKGLWFKRFIEGKWVLAEGTIYDFFDDSIHVIDKRPGEALYYVVGVDYGTTNPTAFSLIGFNNATYPNLWLEDEYYYDSKEKMRQKTDSEYCDDLIKFIQGKKIKAIVVDPSAASFKAEMMKRGIDNVMDANNDVLDGIRFHGKLLSNGTFKILRDCKETIKEYGSYVWDPHSIKLGIDKPMKQNDHILDSIRYALMTHFKPIFDGSNEMDVNDYRRWKRQYGWQ